MADRFTADKLAWVEQVAMDPEVGHLAARVAALLALRYLNRETGEAWPSQETLGADLSVTSRAIRTAIGHLAGRHHLAVEVRTGTRTSSRYRPILKTEARNDTSGSGLPRPGTVLPVPDAETRKFSAQRTGSRLPTNPLKEPSESSHPENPVCVPTTHKKAFRNDEEALAYVRDLITKANVEADPRKVLLACKSHHGDAWQAKLKTWTLGAIARSAEKPRPIPRAYDGPEDLRADVVRARGEGYAASYLDTCRWRDEDRTILARHEFMAKRLVEDMGRDWLNRREISVGVMAANDVPANPPKGRVSWV